MDTYLSWALGLLISTLLGILVAQNRKQSELQQAANLSLTELRTLLLGVNGSPGVVSRLNDLHEWRNQMMMRESADLRRQIDEMRRGEGQ
jgi:hypothetical protein